MTMLACVGALTGCRGDATPKGIIPGQALAKFCHQFYDNEEKIDLTLEIGDPVVASITTHTNSCSPVLGQPCVAIPVGNVPVRVKEGSTVISSRYVLLNDQAEYVFDVAVFSSGIGIGAYRLAPGYTCTNTDFVTPPDLDGGVDGGGDGAVADGPIGSDSATDGAADVLPPLDVPASLDVAADVPSVDDATDAEAHDAPATGAPTD